VLEPVTGHKHTHTHTLIINRELDFFSHPFKVKYLSLFIFTQLYNSMQFIRFLKQNIIFDICLEPILKQKWYACSDGPLLILRGFSTRSPAALGLIYPQLRRASPRRADNKAVQINHIIRVIIRIVPTLLR